MTALPSSSAQPARTNPEWARAARDLLATLQEENRALTDNDVDALESAVRSKQALVARLGVLDPRQFDTETKSLVEQCRRLNEKNGAIVAARMYLTQRSLAILRGETGSSLYGPRGAVLENGPGGRSIARA